MAIDWCEKVNGVTIFPKLPVYLRTHFETFEHGQRVRDALKSMAGELEKLTAMEVETRDAAAVVTAAASSASSSSGTGEGGGGGMGGGVSALPAQHQPLPPYQGDTEPEHYMVAGLSMNFVAGSFGDSQSGSRGRGKDKAKRKGRSCGDCTRAGRAGAAECEGSAGKVKCPKGECPKKK